MGALRCGALRERTRGGRMCRGVLGHVDSSPTRSRRLHLSGRRRQTLEHLLTGLSEKEVAASLGLSINTVHQYVKQVYGMFGVGTRAELLARFLPELSGPALIKLIQRGQLYSKRATVGAWASLCADTGRSAGRLSEGVRRGKGNLWGTLRQPTFAIRTGATTRSSAKCPQS